MSGWIVFLVGVLTIAGIYALLALVLNFEAGWAGLWDLGTAGFLAVGSYFFLITTRDPGGITELTISPGWPVWAGVLGAAVFTGLVGLLVGIPALRLRGEYFLITTFAFAEVFRQLAINLESVTNGVFGIHQVDRPFSTRFTPQGYNVFLLLLVIAAVGGVLLLQVRISRSPNARILRAMRDNEILAVGLGKNVAFYRAQIFGLSGVLVGATGALYVWYIRSIFPDLFVPTVTFTTWTAVVVGGLGGIAGPAIGAFLLVGLAEGLALLPMAERSAATVAAFRPLLLGAALILVLRFRPRGILGEKEAFGRVGRAREHATRGQRSKRPTGSAPTGSP